MSGLLDTPSLTMGKRTFQTEYGPESVLVVIQDLLLKEFADSPWFGYHVPHDIRRKAVELWINKK
jgi:hypothetical protein